MLLFWVLYLYRLLWVAYCVPVGWISDGCATGVCRLCYFVCSYGFVFLVVGVGYFHLLEHWFWRFWDVYFVVDAFGLWGVWFLVWVVIVDGILSMSGLHYAVMPVSPFDLIWLLRYRSGEVRVVGCGLLFVCIVMAFYVWFDGLIVILLWVYTAFVGSWVLGFVLVTLRYCWLLGFL